MIKKINVVLDLDFIIQYFLLIQLVRYYIEMRLPIALRDLRGMSRGNLILWFQIVTPVRSEYIQQLPADHRFSHFRLPPGTLDVLCAVDMAFNRSSILPGVTIWRCQLAGAKPGR